MKALEGFSITDRRGEPKPQDREPEMVERIDGVEMVYVMRDGRKVLIRRAGHDVAVLEHSFVLCPTCGEQHMRVGDESVECPRLGWTWRMGQPIYTSGVRVLESQRDEASVYNRSVSRNLDIIAREVERRTGAKI